MIYITTAVLFYFINFIYIKIWKKIKKSTPTGVGIFLIFHLFFYIMVSEYSLFYFILLVMFSFFYYLDDLITINFKWRILIQILTPVIIYFSTNHLFSINTFILIILFFFILINTLNFQDGEDLNIGILLSMLFLAFYFYSTDLFVKKTSGLILMYLIAFVIFNRKKNFLYLGDTGCYISSIIIFLFMINDFNNHLLIKVLLSIIYFPIIDVFFVQFYRIYKKENLLSRNYLHVYQILFRKIKSKIYLLPNIIFALINISITIQMQLSIKLIFVLTFLNIVFCVILRLMISKFTNYYEN